MARYKFTTENFQDRFAELVAEVKAADLSEELAVARIMLQEGLAEFEEAASLNAVTDDQKRVRQYSKSIAEIKIQTWIDKVAAIAEKFNKIATPANDAINYMLNAQFPILIQQAITTGLEAGHDAKQITAGVTQMLEGDKDRLLRQTTILPSTDVVVQLMDDTVPADIVVLEERRQYVSDSREPVSQVG